MTYYHFFKKNYVATVAATTPAKRARRGAKASEPEDEPATVDTTEPEPEVKEEAITKDNIISKLLEADKKNKKIK